MPSPNILLLCFYFFLLGVLSLYGVHRIIVMRRFWIARHQNPSAQPLTEYPLVTIQLPLYNEHNVAARIIDAAAALRWPIERSNQVLDDLTTVRQALSTHGSNTGRPRHSDLDSSTKPARALAGALAYGLQRAKGQSLPFSTLTFASSLWKMFCLISFTIK